MVKPALGRGLGALLGGVAPAAKPAAAGVPPVATTDPPPPDTRERVERIELSRILPSALQPRKDFPAEALQELADSIREQGIIQPLLVRAQGRNYELIAGERRWRAAQMLGLSEVPVIIREADDTAVLELMLIENLQRENLNAIEEAQGYSELIERFQLSQDQAALKVGKSRAAVANSLRLLKLSPEIQSHIRQGRLTVGHAKVILGLSGAAEQMLAADRVTKDGLNVRQTEELVAYLQKRSAPGGDSKNRAVNSSVIRDAHVSDLENRLQQKFATKVLLRYRQGKGSVEIRFFTDDDLDRILEIVGLKADEA